MQDEKNALAECLSRAMVATQTVITTAPPAAQEDMAKLLADHAKARRAAAPVRPHLMKSSIIIQGSWSAVRAMNSRVLECSKSKEHTVSACPVVVGLRLSETGLTNMMAPKN